MTKDDRPDLEVDGKRWYSVTDAARVLGVSKSSLRRRIILGLVQTCEVDGQKVIPRSRLFEALQEGSVHARVYRQRPTANASRNR